MAQYQLLLLCLILADAYVNVTMAADEKTQTTEQTQTMAPTPSPSNDKNLYKAQAPVIRKLGKHQASESKPPTFSPSSALASTNPSPETEESLSIVEEEIHLKKHHHSLDKSVAGGGVILGGLATTFLVAVFCYIRATARHKADTAAPGAHIAS
ncbi:unnamed protein product [Prunus armeniaca]|uniref:Uncharacterized protein n=1 Tax=Prunus armeniaca TaxID=36596 RepID=A0A6J5V6K0_PRUAR|nr:hypothetical protein GBA52_019239 [Prunus armeniaca]CAB4284616.1 unnamed protein product [Prunus armeniaca]CAB4315033.1 unnamed protein product [Prunus armeniaca]